MKPVLIIQNTPVEHAGRLRGLLTARGLPVETLIAPQAAFLPGTPADFAGIVVMGGPQAVYEEAAYPYLSAEIALCREAVAAGVPVLGICLGGQVLARALGGSVKPGPDKEIGWAPLTFMPEGQGHALFAGLPAEHPAFHFHGDCFELPPGCTGFAATATTPCQGFFRDEKTVAFQFHPEVDRPLIEDMLAELDSYVRANGFDPERIRADSARYLEEYTRRYNRVFERWIDTLER